MEEKKITKAEFDKAVMVNDDQLKGMAAFLVPMTGTMFAKEMRDILFPEETEGSKEC